MIVLLVYRTALPIDFCLPLDHFGQSERKRLTSCFIEANEVSNMLNRHKS